MARWLSSLFFLLILVGSVPAGTPFSGAEMKNGLCPMKCCKKAKQGQTAQERQQNFLCRTMICSEEMPTNSGSNVQTSFAPVFIASEKITLFEILFSTTPKEEAKVIPASTNVNLTAKIQPKYIRHLSLLI